MIKQNTDWGQILWLAENREILPLQGLQVGIVSLFPGRNQARHIHYDEQVIYVVRGQARSIINGEESVLSAGDFLHWKAGVEHQVYNIGSGPFQHLLISNPYADSAEQVFPGEKGVLDGMEVSPDLIYVAIEAIRTQFLETLHYAYAIFDAQENLVLQSDFYPEYCVNCCRPAANPGACPCMHQLQKQDMFREQSYHCRYGMEVFYYPIFFRNRFLGYIQSGYVRHAGGADNKIENVYDVPESVVAGIKSLLRRIVKAVKNYCEFEQFRRNLVEKELCISSHEEAQRILMKDLKDAQYAVTDLKINNHFLFNTLNSMASMALDGGQMPLYQSIVDLAKMFHYTLRTQNSVVSLRKEVDYVKAYLQLQKLRYGDDLEIMYEIQEEALECQVPFNFLQPILENAFVHGFSESIRKKIRLEIEMDRDRLEIRVSNTGKPLSPQTRYAVNQGILSNTSHGLFMIYNKLLAAYGEEFSFRIGEREGYTCFFIGLPTVLRAAGKERK